MSSYQLCGFGYRKNGPRDAQIEEEAAVIICSDGESSDGKVSRARALAQSALSLLFICTDHKKVVDYWNNIDKELELEMDVIDDLVQDAKR